MIPNKTEEQILYQNFKYFDLEGAGFCNLRDFIKANEKLGVVLSHMQEFQDIFNYFDRERCGVINYKKFCKEIFQPREPLSQKSLYQQPPKSQPQSNSHNFAQKKKQPFFDKLVNILVQSGPRALISLNKEFKLLDFNNMNRLTIDDFIKVFTENKISLTISDIQTLFHSYELNNNGFFYYEEMFKDLKNLFWSTNRTKFILEFFAPLLQNNNSIKVNDLRNMFNPSGHKYIKEIGEAELVDEFDFILDSFLCIKRMNKGNYQLSKSDIEDFFKFYSFGIESDEEFFDIISGCFIDNPSNEGKAYVNRTNQIDDKPKSRPQPVYTTNISNYASGNMKQNNPQIDNVVLKLKTSLMKFGLKSFFGLMKHFKYYDNGTKMITKYDFAKVLKDFRLNLTVNEIEKIFDAFCTDSKKVQMNYEEFIISLTHDYNSEVRAGEIGEIFDKINAYAKSIGEKTTIDLIKSLYWARENFFGLDENQALNEFCDNIEVFHYGIKGNKSPIFTREEFIDFYKIISFLVEDNKDFSIMINTEWKKVMNEPSNSGYEGRQQYQRPTTPILTRVNPQNSQNRFNNTTTANNNNFYQAKNENRTPYQRSRSASRTTTPNRASQLNPLQKLETKLRKRGIRGLMNLHKQFLFSCPDLTAISYDDFTKVLKLQRLDLQQEDYNYLFDNYTQEENKNCLNFPNFIRAFKKVLNDTRLAAVEKVFGALDRDGTENLFIDDIKFKFSPKNHPEVIRGRKNEDEIITEFLDCFELNYNLLTTAENPETSNLVSFEEFANFYEYVSFLYENDNDFVNLVEGSWN